MNSRSPGASGTPAWRRQWRRTAAGLCLSSMLVGQAFSASQTIPERGVERIATVTVSVTPGHPANRFDPKHAFGGAVDGHDKGEIDRQLKPENIREMLSAGLHSLSYRLRTELAIDAWHWNPRGSWSDTTNQQGYWTSDSSTSEPIQASYGFSLPRRGNTIDQANNEGYSRLDDGDDETFWKSNPYLDRHFTHDDNSLHPQWIVIEFSEEKAINAARLLWGTPSATSFRVQYATFDDTSDLALNPPGMWRDFPLGRRETDRKAPAQRGIHRDIGLFRLAARPIRTRFVRILMSRSSGIAPEGSTDIRDGLGFAMREIYLGSYNKQGEFHDEIQHGNNRRRQTIMYASSTDPWHRASDLDEGVEEPGFDRIFQSGLTNNLPMLLPAGILYDTPDNAANEIRYLRARGFKFDRVELGEEPDGQYATPEDFGALYLQWAEAIHAVDPTVKIGGPSFQEIQADNERPRDLRGNSAWLSRFLRYLDSHGRARDYQFFSFEWYPFDEICEPVAPQLARAPDLLTEALREMQRRGLSRRLPWIISEYGYSAFASRAEISIEGALLNADIVGKFLSLGGDQAFLFGYTPAQVLRDAHCTAGNNMMLLMDEDGDIRQTFATYFGARLMTQEWTMPTGGVHELYPAVSNVRNTEGEELVTGYVVHRPDGLWSLMLINKDPNLAYKVRVNFRNELTRKTSTFDGAVDVYQFSGAQYEMNNDMNNPAPTRALAPQHTGIEGYNSSSFDLPAYSLTVIRGRDSANESRKPR